MGHICYVLFLFYRALRIINSMYGLFLVSCVILFSFGLILVAERTFHYRIASFMSNILQKLILISFVEYENWHSSQGANNLLGYRLLRALLHKCGIIRYIQDTGRIFFKSFFYILIEFPKISIHNSWHCFRLYQFSIGICSCIKMIILILIFIVQKLVQLRFARRAMSILLCAPLLSSFHWHKFW